jgi:hypothetical protein
VRIIWQGPLQRPCLVPRMPVAPCFFLSSKFAEIAIDSQESASPV